MFVQRGPVGLGHQGVRAGAWGPPPDRVVAQPGLTPQRLLVDLAVAHHRDRGGHPDEPWRPLGAQIILPREEFGEVGGVELGAGNRFHHGHHLITRQRVRDADHRDRSGGRVARQDSLDRSGREVLRVDPQPVAYAAGEPEHAVGVAVRQIAGPEPTVAQPVRVGLGIVPVALERSRGIAPHEFPGGTFGVGEPAVLVEQRGLAFPAVLGHHCDVGTGRSGAQRSAFGGRHQGDAALTGAVPADHAGAEPFPEGIGVAR